MAEKKRCFIIMPIKTPESFIEKYRDGVEHFKHVLDCLFIPSVKLAGYKHISPIAKGSDLIQAEIIRNLETSEIVLCDMSCLNPNVFFEFGIRTSLNKPVCVVKDELTNTVPFDTGILNYHEYTSSLDPWKVDKERIKLCDHLTTSQKRSKGENTLWCHFGLRSKAQPYEGETGTDAKLDFLNLQMDALHQKIDSIDKMRIPRDVDKERSRFVTDEVLTLILNQLPKDTALLSLSIDKENTMIAKYKGSLPLSTREHIEGMAYNIHGVNLNLIPKITPPPTKKKDDGSKQED